MSRYRLDERSLSGAFTDRLNPRIVERQLNEKLGPRRPRPLVRETSAIESLSDDGAGATRRRIALLPDKFYR